MISRANRGRSLERLLEISHDAYRHQGRAVVQKVATPTKVLQTRAGLKVIREKSTVDFVGVIRGGRMVAFDAKQNREPTRFPFDDRWAHEVEFLRAVSAAGGVTFLVIEHVAQGRVYLLPGARLLELWDEAKRGGRRSIPLSMLETCPVVPSAPGIPVDWLTTLEREGLVHGPADQLVHVGEPRCAVHCCCCSADCRGVHQGVRG